MKKLFSSVRFIVFLTVTMASLFSTAIVASAQDPLLKSMKEYRARKITRDPNDTTKRKWLVNALFSFNLSTGSLSNWSAGGDDFSLSANTFVNVRAFYKKDRHRWNNVLDMNLGYINTTTLGSRKNDDRIDLVSKYGYALREKLDFTVLFNFRSQFFKGYAYGTDSTGKTVATLSSSALSPAYILLGLGFDYRKIQELSIFISPLTSRLTLVEDATLSAKGLYGVDSGRHSKNALGAYASVNYSKPLNKVLNYTARVDLFSNYKVHPGNIDLYVTNLLSIKLSKVLSASWNVDLIYDDDVKIFGPKQDSPRLQLKSLVGIGLLVRL